MKLLLTDPNSGGHLLLLSGEQNFDHHFYSKDRDNKYFTIVWKSPMNSALKTLLISAISSKSPLLILPFALEIRNK